MQHNDSFDVIIVGSGAAGLSLALRLTPDHRVAVVSKGEIRGGSTNYAQGGISAVLDNEDSLQSHVDDTMEAGAGLCDPETVRYVVGRGPECVGWLIDLGVPFTRDDDNPLRFHLTREGGHSHRRVIHAADSTGRAVATTLESLARERDNCVLVERVSAVDLIVENGQSRGLYVLDHKTGDVLGLRSKAVVLATGGASMVYLYCSNPEGSTGDGIAMAWRAGCRIANMEFMQFHPTCLYHPKANSFLITEAIRGEGGELKLPKESPSPGKRFMPDFDERAELAPRDIVARAIDHEMKRLGIDHVDLDISHKPAEFVREHFPTIYERCLKLGYDMTTQPLPVVPAAHYTCGGVVTDLNGRTDIDGLYAIGETACTGLHGANRMASNSLLECLVFAAAADEDLRKRLPDQPEPESIPAWDASRVTDSQEQVLISANWQEIRRLMWDYVGIVRSNSRLDRARWRIERIREEIEDYYARYKVNSDFLELRNLAKVADLIIRSARTRKESRGLHFTVDFPATSVNASDTSLQKG